MSFIYSEEQLEFLRRGYKELSVADLTVAFNQRFGLDKPVSAIKGALTNHRITSGRSGRFEPGIRPWNTGTHYTAGGRSAETRFKKGQKPQTWVPVGTEVRDRDGYLKRKVRDDAPSGVSRHNWKFVHVLVWEEHNGPVPAGHAIIFRNGDLTDIRIGNLALVTRAELLYLNRRGLAHLPPEIHPAAVSLARLEVRRYELEHETGERRNPC